MSIVIPQGTRVNMRLTVKRNLLRIDFAYPINNATSTVKNCVKLSVRISSYGCTQEV